MLHVKVLFAQNLESDSKTRLRRKARGSPEFHANTGKNEKKMVWTKAKLAQAYSVKGEETDTEPFSLFPVHGSIVRPAHDSGRTAILAGASPKSLCELLDLR
jgi:hypothetical protein